MQNVKTFFRMYRQLHEILNKKEQRKTIWITLLSIISALAETLGVGVILPFILAMLQPRTLLEYKRIAELFDLLNVKSDTEIVACVGIGVILVYILKNTFIMLFNRYKLYFRNNLERDLSIKMLQAYIYRPYSYFLNANSAEIMRGITGDNAAVATVVDNYCTLINEGLTCLMLGIALILINPIMAFGIMGLAGSIALIIVISLRKKIGECSEGARSAFADRYRYSYESINGIKEIDVMKRQSSFLAKFAKAANKASENNTKYLWIAMLPSRLTETVFIIGLVVIVLISYSSSGNITVIAAQLSALGVAAVRILPSISNISNAVNSLVFQRPALENAYDNLVIEGIKDNELPKEYTTIEDDEQRHFSDSIKVDRVYWTYDNALDYVLKDLSIEIKKGEAVGLVGESGAGKSTLADIILGLYIPQKGTITVDGKSIYDADTQWHKMVGYVPQNVFLIDDTIKNNILFGIDESEADEKRIKHVIDQSQIKELIDNQCNGINTVLGEQGVKISGGQRQRIAIARALYRDPEILVLDEATSALDNETESAVMEAINALHGKKTLIIVAHRLTTIDKCDKVYEIKNGKAVRVR